MMVNRKCLKTMTAIITGIAFITGISGCQSQYVPNETEKTDLTFYEDTEVDSWKRENYQEVLFEGDRIFTEASGVIVDGTTVTITCGGTYVFSGVLQNGQIVVDASKNEKVTLVWNGAEIFCGETSPVSIVQADKTIFYLADGTTNVITDGSSDSFANREAELDAAVFAKDDLTIRGTGSLTVNANYYDGIVCKNDLKITGGILTVNAAHQGIKGKDSLTVQGGTIVINAKDDGLKSSNEALVEEDGKEVGWVLVEDGAITIAAGGDAIHAESDLTVNGGSITITESYEGLEGACIYINGGEICLSASDDGINAAGYAITEDPAKTTAVQMEEKSSEGEIERSFDKSQGRNGEKIPNKNLPDGADWKEPTEIERTEGEELVEEGKHISGRGNMGVMGGMSSGGYLEINGGTIWVNADGDGIDVNGRVVMNGGTVWVDGTERSGDGALDYDSTFEINGGVLIGTGNSAMAQTVSSGSSQPCMAVYFDDMKEAGSIITVQNSLGEEILSYTSQKRYNFFTYSCEQLKIEDNYTVWIDGKEEQSFVMSEVVTTSGNVSGMGRFGRPNREEIKIE